MKNKKLLSLLGALTISISVGTGLAITSCDFKGKLTNEQKYANDLITAALQTQTTPLSNEKAKTFGITGDITTSVTDFKTFIEAINSLLGTKYIIPTNATLKQKIKIPGFETDAAGEIDIPPFTVVVGGKETQFNGMKIKFAAPILTKEQKFKVTIQEDVAKTKNVPLTISQNNNFSNETKIETSVEAFKDFINKLNKIFGAEYDLSPESKLLETLTINVEKGSITIPEFTIDNLGVKTIIPELVIKFALTIPEAYSDALFNSANATEENKISYLKAQDFFKTWDDLNDDYEKNLSNLTSLLNKLLGVEGKDLISNTYSLVNGIEILNHVNERKITITNFKVKLAEKETEIADLEIFYSEKTTEEQYANELKASSVLTVIKPIKKTDWESFVKSSPFTNDNEGLKKLVNAFKDLLGVEYTIPANATLKNEIQVIAGTFSDKMTTESFTIVVNGIETTINSLIFTIEK